MQMLLKIHHWLWVFLPDIPIYFIIFSFAIIQIQFSFAVIGSSY